MTPGSISITRPYRLFVPDNYDPGESYPLIMTFHGRGELGDDNEIQISRNRLATAWADTLSQRRHPAFVAAPQAPLDQGDPFYSHFVEFDESRLNSLITEFSIDTDRIYAAGFSMGGDALFRTLPAVPNRFAAAVPMGTSVSTPPARPDKLLELPIWIVHGQKDQLVSVEGSRAWVDAFRHFGLTPVFLECDPEGDCRVLSDCTRRSVVRLRRQVYAEYENAGHDVVNRSLNDPILIDWVFAQRRGRSTIGRVGSVVSLDVDATDLRAQYPKRNLGIVGSKFPLDWGGPLPLCEEVGLNVFGASIAFSDTTTGLLEYKFVHFDSDDWTSEVLGGGVRSTSLSGTHQLLPLVFWNNENERIADKPFLVAPDSGSVLAGAVRLEWTPGEAVGRYFVQADTTALFDSSGLIQRVVRETFLELSDLDTLKNYTWRVRAENVAGSSPWDGPWSFRTIGQTPAQLRPQDGAQMDAGTNMARREWEPYPNKTSYEVSISTDSDFAEATTWTVRGSTPTEFGPLESLTDYYGRVRWLFDGPWSLTWRFTTPAIVGTDAGDLPERFRLGQNYPNPFNPTTRIAYDLPRASDVTLAVVDVLGRQVRVLASGPQSAGSHEVWFDATGFSSGVYLYSLRAADHSETKRMILLR